jgi:hypothetical protein
MAEVDALRTEPHRGTPQRRDRRGGHTAAVILGQAGQDEPGSGRHVQVGAAGKLGQLPEAGQAVFPDRTTDRGQHMRRQAVFTHCALPISMQ